MTPEEKATRLVEIFAETSARITVLEDDLRKIQLKLRDLHLQLRELEESDPRLAERYKS